MDRETGTFRVKSGLAEMLKGGVIMDVTTSEQAKIAEDAGAVAVMALERVPADIRKEGGVARMADPTRIQEIQEAVTTSMMTPPLSIWARPFLVVQVDFCSVMPAIISPPTERASRPVRHAVAA